MFFKGVLHENDYFDGKFLTILKVTAFKNEKTRTVINACDKYGTSIDVYLFKKSIWKNSRYNHMFIENIRYNKHKLIAICAKLNKDDTIYNALCFQFETDIVEFIKDDNGDTALSQSNINYLSKFKLISNQIPPIKPISFYNVKDINVIKKLLKLNGKTFIFKKDLNDLNDLEMHYKIILINEACLNELEFIANANDNDKSIKKKDGYICIPVQIKRKNNINIDSDVEIIIDPESEVVPYKLLSKFGNGHCCITEKSYAKNGLLAIKAVNALVIKYCYNKTISLYFKEIEISKNAISLGDFSMYICFKIYIYIYKYKHI